MNPRIPVAVLGATGSVGQRFVQLLDGHPWFEVIALTGSDRSIGKPYREACHWILSTAMPEWAARMVIEPTDPAAIQARIAFSALPADLAKTAEPEFAKTGVAVCSNASAFRYESDVPILLPEVNAGQVDIIEIQRKVRGWSGLIVTNSNCTSTGLSVAFKALDDAFTVRRAFVVSLQALSGAGYPGVSSMDILDNVIPYIDGEEKKVEFEPRKIIGRLVGETIEPAGFAISAHTNRVAVSDGHIVCASLEFSATVTPDQAIEALRAYQPPEICCDLPSTPSPVIIVSDEVNRPQPRLDRMLGNGMATVVGRVRPDPLFHLKLVVLSHNTIRGAAGGSIYNAELLVKKGLVG